MSQPQTESYTAAKGGISALTHALAVSFAGRVRVNSISPGWIDTEYKICGTRNRPPRSMAFEGDPTIKLLDFCRCMVYCNKVSGQECAHFDT